MERNLERENAEVEEEEVICEGDGQSGLTVTDVDGDEFDDSGGR